MMRVLLVQPSNIVSESWSKMVSPFLPIGLGGLAALLREEGHQVMLLDAYTEGWEYRGQIEDDWIEIGLPEVDVASLVRHFQPQVIGFSIPFTTQMPRLRSLARWVKAIHPEIFVVCGGNHPSCAPHEILQIPEVDMVILGEAETTFPLLLQKLARGCEYTDLVGTAYRDKQGQIMVRPISPQQRKANSIPLSVYDFLPLNKFFKAAGGHRIPIMSSRGCSRTCSYCSFHNIFGRKVRYVSLESLLEHIQYLYETYGVREFFFDDDALTADRERAHALFDSLIARNIRISWTVRNGLDFSNLDEKLLEKMRQSGGRRLSFFVGSGSRRVLQQILIYPLNLYLLEQVINRSLQAGFKITCQFVLGAPGETLEEVYESLNFAWKLRSMGVDEFQFSLATPYVGTELRIKAESIGCSLDLPEPLYTPLEGCVSTPDFSALEIVQIRNTAELEFSSRGLVAEFTKRVGSGMRSVQRPVQRFFHTVAPQPGHPRLRPIIPADRRPTRQIVQPTVEKT